MRQYFFDYVSENESLRDYRGRQFMVDSLAREYAELIAIHLQHDPQGAYFAWSIAVRDVKGAELFSVPVPAPEDDQPGDNDQNERRLFSWRAASDGDQPRDDDDVGN